MRSDEEQLGMCKCRHVVQTGAIDASPFTK